MSYLYISSFPRIHIGLIDLNGCTGRMFGGIGLSLNGYPSEIRISRASCNTLKSFSCSVEIPYPNEVLEILHQCSSRCGQHWEVMFYRTIPQHIGLGSKTATLMSVVEGVSNLESLDFDPVIITRRGGASGVGVNVFYEGGVVVDGGHQTTSKVIVPSRFSSSFIRPPILYRSLFPADWKICLILPKGTIYEGDLELDFFKNNTPIEKEEAFKVLAIVYHKLAIAFKEVDYSLLLSGLVEISRVGFKKREIENQNRACSELLYFLQENGKIAAGMSSMGPLIYAIIKSDDQKKFVIDAAISTESKLIGFIDGRNDGFSISRNHYK